MAILTDTFQDYDGTLLENHISDSGATYVSHPVLGGSLAIQGGYLSGNTPSNGQGHYVASPVPSSPDYDVEADFHQLASHGSPYQIYLWVRMDPTAATGYFCVYQGASSHLDLYKIVAGSATGLASASLTLSSDLHIRLSIRGSRITLYSGRNTILTVIDTAITAAGRVGVSITGTDNTAGFQMYNLKADYPFVNDTFTDTDGTLLKDHTGETGATWTRPSATPSAALVIQGNEVTTGVNTGFELASGTPPNADYEVVADYVVHTNVGNSGLVFRMQSAAETEYFINNNGAGTWQLFRALAGSYVVLASAFGAPTSGTVRLRISGVGSLINVDVDNVTIISFTDSNISSVGQAGVYNNSVGSSSVGQHFDNFSAYPIIGVGSHGSGLGTRPSSGANSRALLGVGI